MTNETPNLPNGTPAELRAFLQSLISDANDALAHLADGRYDLVRETLRCLDVDAMAIVVGVQALADEPRCCRDVCSECRPLDAAEYA